MGNSQVKIIRKAPISTHPAFTPLIAAWLAALMGGVVALLPAALFAIAAEPADFALSQATVAGFAALFGAGLGWVAAELFSAVQKGMGQKQVASAVTLEEYAAQPDAPADVELEPAPVAEAAAEPEPEMVGAEIADASELESDDAPVAIPVLDEAQDAPHYADIVLSELLGAPKSDVLNAQPQSTPALEPELAPETAIASEFAVEPDAHPDVIKEVATATEPVEVEPDNPLPAPPQHGKAVNMLRTQATQELAMPQLIERLAVALDDQRVLAEQSAHSYSRPMPPASMSERLRALIEAPQPAE